MADGPKQSTCRCGRCYVTVCTISTWSKNVSSNTGSGSLLELLSVVHFLFLLTNLGHFPCRLFKFINYSLAKNWQGIRHQEDQKDSSTIHLFICTLHLEHPVTIPFRRAPGGAKKGESGA